MKKAAILLCVVLLAVGYVFAENNSIEVSRFSVFSDKLPESFDGFPIALVTAGLLALAFMGFSGLSIF